MLTISINSKALTPQQVLDNNRRNGQIVAQMQARAQASQAVQGAAKQVVTAAVKRTGFIGPNFAGTGNTQKGWK
jgi:hypothetical protein